MSRRVKIPLYALGGLAGAALVLALAGLIVAQSSWFREKVHQRIVAEAENATGGRVEIGAFDFDWRTLTAEVRAFVIHGTEGAGERPLFRAASVRAGLKILSVAKKQVDIALLRVDRPEVNVIVYEDGRTNVPRPKAAGEKKSPIQTVLDLAIKRFELVNGAAQVAARRIPLNMTGEDIRAQVFYEAGLPRYRGEISLRQLNVTPGNRRPLPLDVNARMVLEANRLEISSAHVGFKESSLDFNGELADFAAPQAGLKYTARIQAKDIVPELGVPQIPGKGELVLTGSAKLSGSDKFTVDGRLHGSGLAFHDGNIRVGNIGVASNVLVTPERLELAGLQVNALGGRFLGRAGLADWKRFEVDGRIQGYSVAELVRLERFRPLAWNAVLSGPVAVTGEIREKRLRDTAARARLTLAPTRGDNPAEGLVNFTYSQSTGSIDFAQSYIATRYSRAQLAGTLGKRMEVAVNSTNLEDFEPAIAMLSSGPPLPLPVKLLAKGTARFQGVISGALDNPSIQGRAAVTRFEWQGHAIDQAEGDVIVSKSGLVAQNAVVAKNGMRAAGEMRLGFREWKPDEREPLIATVTIQASDVAALVAEFGQKAPVTGSLAAEVKIAGTTGAPEASGTAELTNVVAWEQPADSIRGQFQYTEGLLQVTSGLVRLGASRAQVSGAFEHPKNNWSEGRVKFTAVTRGIQLTQIQAARTALQNVQGRIEMQLTGEAGVTPSGFRPGLVNGWAAVKDITIDGERRGSLLVNAGGKGRILNARLEGDFAGSKLTGESEFELDGNYAMRGHAEFSSLALSSLLKSSRGATGKRLPVEGVMAGKLTFSGLSTDRQTWKGALELPAVEVRPDGSGMKSPAAKELVLRNQGPVVVDVTARDARVRQAQFRASSSELAVTGSLRFGVKSPLDLRFRGGLNMQLLQLFDERITSDGAVSLDVSVRGRLERPDVYGQLDLKKASMSLAGLPNGIDNANGLIFLYRDRATIDNLTAESGGGKVAVSGFVNFGGLTSFHLQAQASEVRVRYPEGVSSSMNAKLAFTGTPERSLLAGDVVITRVGFNPRSDLGSMLARSAQPVRVTTQARPFEQGLHFDVHVVTSPQARLETQLTRDIQADADLRLRGDMTRPVLLGRVLVNQGDVLFFGNKYSINSGQILFVNAAKIEPVVNLDLETRARAVEITLHVSGPVDRLNVSYRSDPPLSFPEIVALLTTGREPAAPTAASGPQTQVAQQTSRQAGANALLSQAIANPIAGRLQRFFGVSRLKIDPQITGVTTSNAAARVTVEQQIASNLAFMYITDLSRAQAQTIRVELNFNKDWSAVALREENGLFGIDFLYKKQFK